MIIFLYGPDTFRAKRKLKQIVERYQAKNKSGLNLAKISLTEKSFDELKNFLEAVSMFAEKKLAVIEDLFKSNPETKEKFLQYLEKSDLKKSQDKFVIIFTPQCVFKDKITKELLRELTKPSISSEEFVLLTGARLNQWIRKEVQAQGAKIEPAAVNQLAAYVGSDLWLMNNEIQKLVVWVSAQSDHTSITPEDVEVLVKARIESNIFHLIDALGQKDKNKAFRILHEQLELGERPEMLLGMFVYQFRNLLKVKNLVDRKINYQAISQRLKLHPFVLKKTFWQIKNFSLDELKKIYQRLSSIEISAKTGRVEMALALDLLVAEIA